VDSQHLQRRSEEEILVTQRRVAQSAWAWLAAGCCALAAAQSPPAASDSPPVSLVYLSRAGSTQARASLTDPVIADYGLKGAELGLDELNANGRFLGRRYELIRAIAPAEADIKAAAKEQFGAGHLLIIADLEAADLLAVADLPQAKNAVILDARTSDDALRQSDCRRNVFHLLPNWAMRADALGQYLSHKKWTRWFVLEGAAAEDRPYALAIKRAAARFGAKIVEEKRFDSREDSQSSDTAHALLQSRIPELTHASGDYDVLIVADSAGTFGAYLLFNTWDSRLVAGTHGLAAVAWDPQFKEYAARGVQYRFFLKASREMTERDYGSLLATAVFGEAITRGNTGPDASAIRSYLLSDQFSVPANKGEGLSFRHWDLQLRQPLLLFGPRLLVAMAPRDEGARMRFQTDALGFDEQESQCRFTR
jgi:ABC transporter substrate binding protein (PQQ-dependent alcohol dehydrogenase system)